MCQTKSLYSRVITTFQSLSSQITILLLLLPFLHLFLYSYWDWESARRRKPNIINVLISRLAWYDLLVTCHYFTGNVCIRVGEEEKELWIISRARFRSLMVKQRLHVEWRGEVKQTGGEYTIFKMAISITVFSSRGFKEFRTSSSSSHHRHLSAKGIELSYVVVVVYISRDGWQERQAWMVWSQGPINICV